MTRKYQVVDARISPVHRPVTQKREAVRIAKRTGTRANPSCIVIHYGDGRGPFSTRVTRECYAAGVRVKLR